MDHKEGWQRCGPDAPKGAPRATPLVLSRSDGDAHDIALKLFALEIPKVAPSRHHEDEGILKGILAIGPSKSAF